MYKKEIENQNKSFAQWLFDLFIPKPKPLKELIKNYKPEDVSEKTRERLKKKNPPVFWMTSVERIDSNKDLLL